MTKVFGAVLIIVGCAGVGVSLCQNHRRMEQALEQLIKGLEWMICELNYRMPPLNELCRSGAKISGGTVGKVLGQFAAELDAQLIPDAGACMDAALGTVANVPPSVATHFKNLGASMGKFDLQGQISALETEMALCKRDLDRLSSNRQLRLRNYQTLGLCAGAALVILFL